MKRTIIRMLDEAAETWGDEPYALRKNGGAYVPTSFRQARDMARSFGAFLSDSGYRKNDTFAIMAEGSPEWICAEFGILCAGLVSVPLSIKLLADELPFRLTHSEAKGIVTTHNQLEKVLAAIRQAGIKGLLIVYIDEDADWGRSTAEATGIAPGEFVSLSEAAGKGRKSLESAETRAKLDRIAEEMDEDDLVTISYTSGTTGNPKGIMLTHRNYWSNCHDAVELFGNPIRFRTLVVLPVDHSFAHTVGLYTALLCGIGLYFVDYRGGGIATLRNIPINLKESNPIFLLTVPSLSGNFMKKIIAGIEEKGGLIEKIFKNGIKAGIAWNGDGCNAPPLGTRLKVAFPLFLARTLVFGKIKEMIFGTSMKFCVGGGALLDVKQQDFFAAFGVPVFQGYGLTEAAPIISSNVPKKHKFGTSGVIAPSVECTIRDSDGRILPTGQTGEIVIRGENVMKGYYRNPEATAAALRGGWLWTGDLGYMDGDGFLVVVGREKALLIAEDGEKYSPEEIEEAVVNSTDVIDQIMVWCDHKKYSCALVTLDSGQVSRIAKEKNIKDAETLLKALQEEFYRFRTDPKAKKVQGAWIPACFQIVPTPYSDKDGTVNSSMKLVRHKVTARDRDLIDYSYTKEGSSTVNERNLETVARLFGLS